MVRRQAAEGGKPAMPYGCGPCWSFGVRGQGLAVGGGTLNHFRRFVGQVGQGCRGLRACQIISGKIPIFTPWFVITMNRADVPTETPRVVKPAGHLQDLGFTSVLSVVVD